MKSLGSRRKSSGKKAQDYSGGGSDYPQRLKDLASPQRGMIDNDVGRYGCGKGQTEPAHRRP